MEIRGSSKQINKLNKLTEGFTVKTDIEITLTVDNTIDDCIIMVQGNDGTISEYLRGFKEIKTFLIYGYNRIKKNCPYRMGNCICEKCQLYVIQNNTGDCVHNWQFYKNQ